MTLTKYQFDNLDHLHTLDADRQTITREHLATTWNTSTESAHLRMRRLEAAGLVDIHRPDTNQSETITYQISARGIQEFRAFLLRMDGVIGPPPLHPDIEHATLAIIVLHTYGTEAA